MATGKKTVVVWIFRDDEFRSTDRAANILLYFFVKKHTPLWRDIFGILNDIRLYPLFSIVIILWKSSNSASAPRPEGKAIAGSPTPSSSPPLRMTGWFKASDPLASVGVTPNDFHPTVLDRGGVPKIPIGLRRFQFSGLVREWITAKPIRFRRLNFHRPRFFSLIDSAGYQPSRRPRSDRQGSRCRQDERNRSPRSSARFGA